MKLFRLTPVALLVSSFCAAPLLAQTTGDLGTVTVQGQSDGSESGLIVKEDAPKARSTVNRLHLDAINPSSNPFQAIELMPGVNTFSQDGTGLFGGGVRVRGFAGDQMGFTINGAPVNDSGNFAVYPQEYTDSENLCEISVTQGTPDAESPHAGASGGNVGMSLCGPANAPRLRLSQSLGQLNFKRSFIRVDTGKFADGRIRSFVSYSKSTADKFKGQGGADRDHIDATAEFRPNGEWLASVGVLYNKAMNHNIRALSQAQIASSGEGLDFGTAAPQHLAPGAGAQKEVASGEGYYNFNVNPFENYLVTSKLEFTPSPRLRVAAEPYFWYGFGTGGSQLSTLAESKTSTKLGGGVADINGDGDVLDTVMVYRSSVTRTYRPGITLRTNFTTGAHSLLAGVWYERARHYQTNPAVRFDNNGVSASPWLDKESAFLLRQDGSVQQNRDWLTVNTATSAFVQDNISLMQDALALQLGVRNLRIERDFTNWANEGSTSASGRSDGFYQIKRSYEKALATVGGRFNLDRQNMLFANVAQNMRAPSNFVQSNLLLGGSVVSGALVGATVRQPSVGMETSTNVDFGYRRAAQGWMMSASVYRVDFKNRIARAFDPQSLVVTDYNVGDVTLMGAEVESGGKLNSSWSVYGSLTYTSSEMKSNLQNAALPAAAELTAGKALPDTPEWMAGMSVNYNQGPWFGNVQLKHTGRAYSTLVNDEAMKAYTTVNAALGYKIGNHGLFKNPEIRLNVTNLANEHYLRINSPSGSSFTVRALGAGGSSPTRYIGAPRFVSVTLRSDF